MELNLENLRLVFGSPHEGDQAIFESSRLRLRNGLRHRKMLPPPANSPCRMAPIASGVRLCTHRVEQRSTNFRFIRLGEMLGERQRLTAFPCGAMQC